MKEIYILVDKKTGKPYNFFQQGFGANVFKVYYEKRNDAKIHQTEGLKIQKLELKKSLK